MTTTKMISTDFFPETADIETSSDAYASRFSGATGAWLLKVQADTTLAMLAPYKKARILEVGGGHGQLTSHLIAAGHEVTVLGSAEVCEKRIRTFVEAGDCQFNVGNVLALPYEDDEFDVVISYRFLAHVEQWQAFLGELNRVAKRAVMVDYPTLRSVNYVAPLLFSAKKNMEGNTRPYTCYDESELLTYMQTLGWQVGDRYAQYFWPMVLHRVLAKPGLSAALEGITRRLGLTQYLGSPVILKWVKA